LEAHTLNHIGIERALDQKFCAPRLLFGLGLELFDKLLPNDLPFTLRINHPFEPGKEQIGRIKEPHVQMKLLSKRPFDLFSLSIPKQPVVDEDTGQLVADGPMSQGGSHRRVYSPT